MASFVEGLFDMTRDVKSVKQHLRDFLLLVLVRGQTMHDDSEGRNVDAIYGTSEFSASPFTDPCPSPPPVARFTLTHALALQEFKGEGEEAELFAEEKSDAAAAAAKAEMERRRAIPGLLNPYEAGGDMDDL